MISDVSGASAHVRIVVASQVHYFFSIDSQFAVEEIIPLFDWTKDPLKAEQSWHGFLTRGRLQPGLLEVLIPYFTETLPKITSFPTDLRNKLAEGAAVVVFYGIKTPLESEFFKLLFSYFQEQDLRSFAWGIGNLLEHAELPVVDRVWNSWLKEYWKSRALGLPEPVSSVEADIMASWAVDLKDFFPEAVKMLSLFEDHFSFEHSRILLDIEEKEMIKKYPEASADLLLIYLKSPRSYLFVDAKKLWLDLKNSGLTQEKLDQLREAMLRKLHVDPDEL